MADKHKRSCASWAINADKGYWNDKNYSKIWLEEVQNHVLLHQIMGTFGGSKDPKNGLFPGAPKCFLYRVRWNTSFYVDPENDMVIIVRRMER